MEQIPEHCEGYIREGGKALKKAGRTVQGVGKMPVMAAGRLEQERRIKHDRGACPEERVACWGVEMKLSMGMKKSGNGRGRDNFDKAGVRPRPKRRGIRKRPVRENREQNEAKNKGCPGKRGILGTLGEK